MKNAAILLRHFFIIFYCHHSLVVIIHIEGEALWKPVGSHRARTFNSPVCIDPKSVIGVHAFSCVHTCQHERMKADRNNPRNQYTIRIILSFVTLYPTLRNNSYFCALIQNTDR